jgi:hypothetical protein
MHRRPALVKWLAINRRASTSFTALALGVYGVAASRRRQRPQAATGDSRVAVHTKRQGVQNLLKRTALGLSPKLVTQLFGPAPRGMHGAHEQGVQVVLLHRGDGRMGGTAFGRDALAQYLGRLVGALGQL